MRRVISMLPVLLCLGVVTVPALAKEPKKKATATPAASMTFTIVNVEYEGTKMWLPGTLVVKKGTKVTVNLVNKVASDPNQHGFKIPDYNVEAIVNRGEPKTVEFTADRVGIFPIICQLHPAHVGGELIVLP